MGIAEDAVAGGLGQGGGGELVAFAHEMDVIDGDAPPLEEGGDDQGGVEGTEDGSESIRFGGVVAAQGGVAAADDGATPPGRPRGSGEGGRDLAIGGAGGLGAPGATVDQDRKEGVGLAELAGDVGGGRLDQGADGVDGLHAGGIVIEGDDDFARLGEEGADLVPQGGIGPFGRERGEKIGGGGGGLVGERHGGGSCGWWGNAGRRRSGSDHTRESVKMLNGRNAVTVQVPALTTWLMRRSTQALARTRARARLRLCSRSR